MTRRPVEKNAEDIVENQKDQKSWQRSKIQVTASSFSSPQNTHADRSEASK